MAFTMSEKREERKHKKKTIAIDTVSYFDIEERHFGCWLLFGSCVAVIRIDLNGEHLSE